MSGPGLVLIGVSLGGVDALRLTAAELQVELEGVLERMGGLGPWRGAVA